MADELKRLVQSRHGYRAHLKRLFTTTLELLERCNTTTPEEEDPDTLTELISQLNRKKSILADLDKEIATRINEEELESEVLESEELQSEISRVIMKGKRLQRRLEALGTSAIPQNKNPISPTGTTEPVATLSSAKKDSTETVSTIPLSDTTHSAVKSTETVADTSAPPPTSPALQHDTHIVNTTVRLPRLDLPTFSGNALEWQTFWDGFEAAVHNNSAISGVQKLNYLRSLLRGEASQVVAGFALTSDNYEHSLVLLKDRYGSSHKLIAAQMQAFINLPSPSNTLSGLQQFHDTVERHRRSLSTLGKSADSYEDILVPVILNKLLPMTRKNVAREHDTDEWNLTDLQQAIKKEVRVFEAELMTGHSPHGSHPTAAFYAGAGKTTNKGTGRSSTPSQRTCVFCKGSHSPMDCQTLASTQARKEFVTEKSLCFNCLGKHKVSACTSRYRCRKCHRKHHTSLCVEASPKKQETSEPNPVITETILATTEASLSTIVSQSTTTALFHLAGNTTCLLKTAVANISSRGTYVQSNILFDEGSQRSFLTKGVADCLQVQPHDTVELSLSTFGTGTSSITKLDVATINLHGISGQVIPLTVLIVPTIAAPIHTVDHKAIVNLPYLAGLQLAHPISSDEQFSITLFIGADQYWNIVEDHVIRGNGPTAVGSKLGYLLSGPLETTTQGKIVANTFHVATQLTPNLEQFWSVESVGITPKDELTNSFLDTYITNNVERLSDGSYSARFPWKDSHPPLPTNFSTCAHRTRALARENAAALLREYNT
ncbi:uncharacterized protein [Dysidea avara]|uniref:uncharacterized protein n=1 Tax=Dysidea avara TaxID=196820 RepID=UPI00331BB88A